jgi:hypothetical protein
MSGWQVTSSQGVQDHGIVDLMFASLTCRVAAAVSADPDGPLGDPATTPPPYTSDACEHLILMVTDLLADRHRNFQRRYAIDDYRYRAAPMNSWE